MKNTLPILSTLWFLLQLPMRVASQVQDKMDWPQFLSRHNLVWGEWPEVCRIAIHFAASQGKHHAPSRRARERNAK